MKVNPELIDDENPEWTDEMFANAKLMRELMPEAIAAFKRGKGRPASDAPKVHIGVRLDADVVAWLRSQTGYNGLVNDLIRQHMPSQS